MKFTYRDSFLTSRICETYMCCETSVMQVETNAGTVKCYCLTHALNALMAAKALTP